MDIKEMIAENSANISDLALIAKFERALSSADDLNLINSDLRLSRMQAYLTVIHAYNALDEVENLHKQVVLLNQFRATFCYKPLGFDYLVAELQRSFLVVCISAGMGEAQMQALSYSFDFEDLKANDLLSLRTDKNKGK